MGEEEEEEDDVGSGITVGILGGVGSALFVIDLQAGKRFEGPDELERRTEIDLAPTGTLPTNVFKRSSLFSSDEAGEQVANRAGREGRSRRSSLACRS